MTENTEAANTIDTTINAAATATETPVVAEVPAAEMAGKIRAALDARSSSETLIIARTDAVAVEGFDAALARAEMYLEAGADILFIEATRMPGKDKLILTGQLGEVMKESAQAALSLVKSRAQALGVAEGLFDQSDIHVHVPAGAIPKDGPSAGVAMFVALVSLLTGRTCRSDLAMTGEISLRGLVLPVGGIKEKVVAAVRAGITAVMLPARNRKEFEEILAEARSRLTFHWIDNADQAIATALGAVPLVAGSGAAPGTPDRGAPGGVQGGPHG